MHFLIATEYDEEDHESGLTMQDMSLIDTEKLAEIRDNIQAITFDLWGTLLDDRTMPLAEQSFSTMRRSYFRERLLEAGFPLSDTAVRAAYNQARRVFDVYWQEMRAFGAELGIKVMLEYVGAVVSVEVEMDLRKHFEEIVSKTVLPLFPGTAEALARLHSNYRLGLISDTAWTPGRVLREHLRTHRVLDYFQTIIFSDEIGYCKPHPTVFRKALRQLEVKPQACVHIGDLQFTDIRGAKEAGCYAGWIYRPDYLRNSEVDYHPDIIVSSVAEFAECLLDGQMTAR